MSDTEYKDPGQESDEEDEYSDKEENDITKRTKQTIADMRTKFNGEATEETAKPPSLYRAIYLKRYTWKLVEYMLDSCKDPKCIEDALTQRCGKGESLKTCLTLAFEKDLNTKVLENLVRNATPAVMELTDESHRTPFHYAVQYGQCTDERVEVIRLLLEKDGDILRRHNLSGTSRPIDTFLDHKHTRKEEGRQDPVVYSVYEKEPPKLGSLPPKEARGQLGGERDRGPKRIGQDREKPKYHLDPKLDETERLRQELRDKEIREHHERKAREDKRQQVRIPERDGPHTMQLRDPKERLDATVGDKPRVWTQKFDAVDINKKEKKKTLSKRASKKPDPKVLAKNSAQILSMLKLHYMRTRSINMATSFLCGKNIQQDIQICFDYEGLPSEIKDHVFLERFGRDSHNGIQFDEVLMYVRFSIVAVERNGRRAQKHRALGRQDMGFFFEWLYSKGAIQISLDKIVVEHLDWQKTDLDPHAICQISSKAEAVGSDNPREGILSRIKHFLCELEVVNLNVPAQLDLHDRRDWVQDKIDEFGIRLNRNANECRNIDIMPNPREPNDPRFSEASLEDKRGTEMAVSSSLSKTTERSNPVTDHDWIVCVEQFAGCMDQFWKETVDVSRELSNADSSADFRLSTAKSQNMNALQNLSKDVVVALIDDGVDCCDSGFSGRVIEGKTFDYQNAGVGQYYTSARGHGSEMARMIWKVCPMAAIYAVRLKTHISPEKRQSTIDAAIESALEKNTTIISMSWTIPKACSRNALMFCSSSDQISATKHYPSAFRRSRFFLIGATHDDGSAYGHAGKSNDFTFPGVNVSTSGGSSLPAFLADKMLSSKEATGSSIAMALAAGLAAIITYCFKASALAMATARMRQGKDYVAGSELVQPGDVEKIAEHSVLKTAFNRIGRKDNGQFTQVWDRFNPATLVLEGEGKYEDKLTCIMKLCSNLIER
ncbi:hypothetical protein LZ31DRAFT_567933 [Colletotrichum somersetense]|nr:hypothetical protein LZ31DRAFT_567933 [Colletotrichum somersetense]